MQNLFLYLLQTKEPNELYKQEVEAARAIVEAADKERRLAEQNALRVNMGKVARITNLDDDDYPTTAYHVVLPVTPKRAAELSDLIIEALVEATLDFSDVTFSVVGSLK